MKLVIAAILLAMFAGEVLTQAEESTLEKIESSANRIGDDASKIRRKSQEAKCVRKKGNLSCMGIKSKNRAKNLSDSFKTNKIEIENKID